MARERVIVCAALRFTRPDGSTHVVCGVRHMDQFMRETLERMCGVEGCGKPEQGFVDNQYRFLDRWEALTVAEAAGQINKRRPKSSPPDRLFSEDLY